MPSLYEDMRGVPGHVYALNEKRSVPACNSLGCNKGSVLDGKDAPSLNPDLRGGTDIVTREGKIWTYGNSLHQKSSIPACDSTGCKTATYSAGWNVPTMSPEVYGNNGEYTYATDDHKALTTGLSQRTSVPACNSLGCSTGSVTASYNVPSLNPDLRGETDIVTRDGKIWTYGNSLHQKSSIPACDSTGCKTATYAAGWNVPTMSPEVYGNNGEYTYATNDHKGLTTGLSQVRDMS